MNGIMILVLFFVLGVGIGALLVLWLVANPIQTTNEELLEHIEKCEYERWKNIK